MSDGDNSDESTGVRYPVSRRKMLAAFGVSAMGAFAGCSSGNGNDTTTSGGGGTTTTNSETTTQGSQPTATETTTNVQTSAGQTTGEMTGKTGTEETSTEETGTGTQTANGTTMASGEYGYDKSKGRIVNPPSDPVTTEITTALQRAWTPSTFTGNPWSSDPAFFPNVLKYAISWGLWDEVVANASIDGPANIILKNVESKGPCEEVVTFHEGSKWWDGTPVTVRDMKVTQDLTNFFWGDPATYHVIDDYNIRLKYKTPTNKLSGGRSLVNYPLKFQADYWQDELDKLKNAEEKGEDALKNAKKNFADITFPLKMKRDKGLGSGLWKPVKWSESKVVHEKNEGHFRSDWTNLEKWTIKLASDNSQMRQLRKNNEVDLYGGGAALVPKGTDLERRRSFYNNASRGIVFNYRKPHVGNVEVRQAIAYLLDYEKIGKALQKTTGTQISPPFAQSGLARPINTNWLGEDWMKQNLIDYGTSAQPEKAAKRLKAGGYSKQGGKWADSDGNEMNGLTFISEAGATQKTTTGVAASQLKKFGIGVKSFYLSDNFDQRVAGDHDYSMANEPIGATNGLKFIDPNNWWAPKETNTTYMAAWNQDKTPKGCKKAPLSALNRNRDTWPLNGAPAKAKYPSKPKTMELGDSPKQIDPIKWYYTASQRANAHDYIVEKDRAFARWFNYSVPTIQFYDENWSHVLDTKHFMNPDTSEESDIMFAANQLRGLISAKGK